MQNKQKRVRNMSPQISRKDGAVRGYGCVESSRVWGSLCHGRLGLIFGGLRGFMNDLELISVCEKKKGGCRFELNTHLIMLIGLCVE